MPLNAPCRKGSDRDYASSSRSRRDRAARDTTGSFVPTINDVSNVSDWVDQPHDLGQTPAFLLSLRYNAINVISNVSRRCNKKPILLIQCLLRALIRDYEITKSGLKLRSADLLSRLRCALVF
jgi:hypothetical protein